VFEEPDFKTDKPRNNQAIPFDFIYLIIIILRKLFKSEMNIVVKGKKIGRFLSKTFLRGIKFKNYIVLSQSMLPIFSEVNPDSRLFDMQHGIIYSGKENYISKGVVSENLIKNNVNLLLNGNGFKAILEKSDSSDYFKNNAHIIGVKTKPSFSHKLVNKNILVTLQFTEDHSKEQNKILLEELLEVVENNRTFTFFIRNHPRFNNEVDLSVLSSKTKLAPSLLSDCFKLCSIHLTSYSTTTFECAEFGIPTVFLKSLENEFNIFKLDYKYPGNDDIQSVFDNYKKHTEEVVLWKKQFYTAYDDKKFISLLK
jgi:hypothetical protein